MEADTIANTSPLVVICGPTASGKTALAIKLARRYGGEIICADSRTIYKGMDIGTAKPTASEQAIVPHWGIDIVEPGDTYSVAQFKEYALTKMSEIRSRGNIPFLVGGTGLYVDAVVLDYTFGPLVDKRVRTRLEKMTTQELQNYCIKNNIKLPSNKHNKRHLIRTIELKGQNNKRRVEPIDNSIVVAISTEREELRSRIKKRSEQFFNDNVVKEAKILGKKYGWDSEAMTGNIYPIMHRYILGDITLEQAKEQFFYSDWHLAKRQSTWLRRNTFVQWYSLTDAEHFLEQQLASYKNM